MKQWIILTICLWCFPSIDALAQSTSNYHFLVAGHAYGSHEGENVGLYPNFLRWLYNNPNVPAEFLILTGDIVRDSVPASWDRVQEELKGLNFPVYYVMGNHDVSDFAYNLFKEKFGGAYYSFNFRNDLFIILDTQEHWGHVSKKQLQFLQKTLKENFQSERIFIFMHELIWTAHTPKYNHIRHNYGSYDDHFTSNFWEEVFPLIERQSNKEFYIVAGDVGGNPGVIPAFYEKIGHIHLIASGMGEIRDENYLKISVSNDGVDFQLIPLNVGHTLSALEEYTVQQLQR